MSTEAVNPSPANPGYTKVFIGNLAFATREEALTKAFDDLNIKLHSVNVVVKRGRSMGYGFVEIDEKDYQTAFEKLHKSQLDERTINLEKATSTNSNKQTKKPRKPRQNKRKTGGPNTKAGGSPAAESKATTNEQATGDKPAAGAAAAKKKRNTRRKKKPATSAKPEAGQAAVVENGSGAPAANSAAPAAAKKPRAPKKPKAPAATAQKRDHSNTELYVANIPFTLTDDELKQEFAQFGCVSATVIINSYGKNKGKSNRGYGFVKVDTEDNQKAAIEQDKKLKIGGRDISIKPAFVRTEPVAKPAEASKDSEAKADAPKETPKADAPKSEEAKKE